MPGVSDQPLSPDTIFELLAHHRRRTILALLQTYSYPLPLADVAEEVAVREHDTSIDGIPADEVKRIYMTLYHRHIPKLSQYEVVSYDQDRDMVALTERGGQLLAVMDVAIEEP